MSSVPSAYQVSQGYAVLSPKSGNAYPIPCEEWEHLKEKMQRATTEPWIFHTIGSALLGSALSAVVPIVTGAFILPAQQNAYNITWVVFISSAISSIACLYFANKEREVHRDRVSDVVAQMQLIEKRFERASI